MKKTLLVMAVMCAAAVRAGAQISVVDPSFSIAPYLTDSAQSGSTIVSYDWGQSGTLYYQIAAPDSTFGGLYQAIGGSITTIAPATTSAYAGASVVSIGNYVYYNVSDANTFASEIFKYGPVGSGPSVALTSTTSNYGLYKNQGQLFITGLGSTGKNDIFYSTLNATTGALNSDPAVDLGVTSGASGPLAFGVDGTLYYAPGFNDPSIYSWTAAEVAAAIADPVNHPLTITGHQWVNYGSLYGTDYSGATSMLVEPNGQLLLTLTSFNNPSLLVGFGIGSQDAYSASTSDGTILQSLERFGELRMQNGNTYLSSDNQIVQVVPEPSAALILGLGLAVFAVGRFRRRFKRTQSLIPTAAGLFILPICADAATYVPGPYSPAGDVAGSTSIPAGSSSFVEWASGVSSFTPGPVDITVPTGAKASFGVPANALGPSDATASNPNPVVSLGDGGSITLTFNSPIKNGPGADLAVFENGFKEADGNQGTYFLELAYVAVSSNGVNYFTFPSVSLTQNQTQIPGFGTLDPTYIYDLAGNTIAGYGTPFDLQELAGVSPLLDINNITSVRITDVIGDIDPTYASRDSQGNIINDPWKTNFTAGGFDLDAVGVINQAQVPEPGPSAFLFAVIVPFCAANRNAFRWIFSRRNSAAMA